MPHSVAGQVHRWLAYPALRAVEALGLLVPLFLLLFASTYFLIDRASTANFTQTLTRTDALYFMVTVFTTVGFGDISAKSETARVLVMLQMLADLAVLGAGNDCCWELCAEASNADRIQPTAVAPPARDLRAAPCTCVACTLLWRGRAVLDDPPCASLRSVRRLSSRSVWNRYQPGRFGVSFMVSFTALTDDIPAA